MYVAACLPPLVDDVNDVKFNNVVPLTCTSPFVDVVAACVTGVPPGPDVLKDVGCAADGDGNVNAVFAKNLNALEESNTEIDSSPLVAFKVTLPFAELNAVLSKVHAPNVAFDELRVPLKYAVPSPLTANPVDVILPFAKSIKVPVSEYGAAPIDAE